MLSLQAWEGMFTIKQLVEISNMSQHAAKYGVALHDVIRSEISKTAKEARTVPAESGFTKKPIRKCPKCGGVLKLFSVPTKESIVYKSKWECCKTCKSSGCGYKEYSTKEIETIIEEVGNGSPK